MPDHLKYLETREFQAFYILEYFTPEVFLILNTIHHQQKTRYYNNYFRICQQQFLLLLSTTQPIHSSFSSINLQRCLERETHKLTKKIKVGEKWFEDVLGLEEWGELLTHAQSTGIHLGMLMTVPRPLQLQPRPTDSSAPFSLWTLCSYFIDNKSI